MRPWPRLGRLRCQALSLTDAGEGDTEGVGDGFQAFAEFRHPANRDVSAAFVLVGGGFGLTADGGDLFVGPAMAVSASSPA